MRYLRLLLSDLRIQARMFPAVALNLLAIPLVLGLFMAFTLSTSFEDQALVNPLRVDIQDEDESPASQLVTQVLGEELSLYFDTSSDQTALYTVTIPLGYGEALGEEPLPLEVDAQMNASVSRGEILLTTLDSLTRELHEQQAILSALEASGRAQAEQLALLGELTELRAHNPWQPLEHRGPGAYTAREYYAITMLSFLLIVFLTTLLESQVGEQTAALRKRMHAAPPSRRTMFLVEAANGFLLFLVVGILYLLIWRLIDGGTFQGKLLHYLVLLTCHGLVLSLLAGLLGNLVSRDGAKIVNMLLIVILLVFTGYLPLDRMLGEGPVASFFAGNPVQQVTTAPYFVLHNGGGLGEVLPFILGSLVLAVLLIPATVAVIQLRKEP